jgi:hypothetical protein
VSECKKCGSPLQEGQDWCLQCGTGRPHSLGGGPGWRTGLAILATTALLVCGASVAAYAALNKTEPKTVVAAVGVKATTTPVPSTTTPGAPGTTTAPTTTPVPGTPTTVKGAPPQIPLQTPTPQSSGADNEANNALFPPETKTTKTPAPTKTIPESTKSGSETGTSEGGSESGSEAKSGSGAEPPSPILLDTNAASTYNPYGYPATLFGEPSRVIDNEAKTAWTAQVQAEVAPKMAEGVVLDLKNAQKLGRVTVKTTTPGITVEVYGANGSALPTSISDPAWNRIVGLKVLKKKSTSLAVKAKDKGYRFVLLWLAKAPATSTAANPGTVSINEFELFPPK